ncbi:MAG: sulfatase-like hydrolase/transferase [Bacteroidales bacterium]|nr:sulfatase-like hydrolase/transferase [Bacteroidales bacterium]
MKLFEEMPVGLSNYFLIIRRLLLLLLLYALSRYVFLKFNQDLFGSISLEELRLIFKGGFRFDLSAVLYVNALYLFLALFPLPALYRPKGQKWLKALFVAANSIAFAVNTADFYYFRFTLRRTDMSFFREFQGGADMGKIVLESMVQQWPLVLFWIGLTAALVFGYGRIKKKLMLIQPWYFYITRSLGLLLMVPLMIIGMRGGVDRTTRPIAMSNAGAYIRQPIEAGIVLNTPFCLIRSTGQKGLPRLSFFESEEELHAVYSPLHTGNSSTPQPYNVVIFILESFAKHHIGSLNRDIEGYTGYTPFLDSLMLQGHACANAYANGRKSIDALPSVLGSIPSLTEPFILLPYSLNHMEGLGALLGRNGYHSSFFHGAPNGSMGFDAIVKMLGFEHYYGKNEYNRDADYDGFWGIWDEPFLQFFAQTLGAFPQPFVSAVFTVSSHHPFKVPASYRGVFPKGPEPVQECIGYTDMALRRFFERAAGEPWFSNTLFVFTADHSLWSESMPQYQNSLGSMAIPILYYFPKVIAPHMDSRPTQQIDIMPTILSYLGYDQPFFGYGRNIFDTTTQPFAAHYSGNYQLLRNGRLLLFDGDRTLGFYDVERDSSLQHNLIDEKTPEEVAPELDFLKAFIQQYNNRLLDNKMTISH